MYHLCWFVFVYYMVVMVVSMDSSCFSLDLASRRMSLDDNIP